jgi:hypothetical protein
MGWGKKSAMLNNAMVQNQHIKSYNIRWCRFNVLLNNAMYQMQIVDFFLFEDMDQHFTTTLFSHQKHFSIKNK